MRKFLTNSAIVLWQKRLWILFIAVFATFLFTRTYLLETRANFSWDQTTIAWAVKSLLVDHHLLLTGMPAKLNTGFSIGPLYYYYAAVFYWITNLDPVASLFISVITAIINFFVVFFIIRKLFNTPVAFVAILLETVSMFLITSEQAQWPVPFIGTISILIFFALYRSITKHPRYLLLLALFVGLSFHIHFTAVFFPIIILCSLPLLPKTKQTAIYGLAGIGIILLFLLPNIISAGQTHNAAGNNLITYLHSTFRMFHGRRFLQLTHDAFIQFDLMLSLPAFQWLVWFIPVAFFLAYFVQKKSHDKLILSYLVALWILIPWIAFTMYTGELTDYYFSITRPIAIFCISFLTVWMWQRKLFVWKIAVLGFWLYFIYANTIRFFQPAYGNFDQSKERAMRAMQTGETIQYSEGVPEAYFYYAYTREKKDK